MEKYQGKILKCGAYKLDTPETFTYEGKTITNTHRLSAQLEDESWVNFGGTDKEDFIVKDDDGKWQILGAGSEVLIKYTTNTAKNGKVYKNAKKSGLTVLELVPGVKYTATSNPGTNSSSNASGVNPAERGQIMNFVVDALGVDFAEASDKDIAKVVSDFYELQDRVEAAMTAPKAPVVQARSEPDEFDDLDDEIPF